MNSDKVKNETPVSLSKRTPSPAASQACEKCGSLFKNVKLHQARGKCSSGEKKSPVGKSSPASIPNSPLESPSKRKTPQKSCATTSPKNEEDSAAKDELLEELDLEQANVTEEVKMISKKIFSCLDILRSIGITGQSALKNIVAFLILKMSEPHIKSGAISFSRPEDYAIDDVFPPEGVPEEELYRTYDCDYIKYACFSELMKVDDRLVRGYVEKLFRLLEKHKLFGKIFSTRTINIDDNNVVCRGVIRKINEIPVETVRTDVIGDAYEFVLSRFGENKDFAQFFTPDWLRTTILEIVSPEMGKTVYDPAAGSGGFLISAVKYWNGLCAASGQTPDLLGFSDCLGGQEIQQDTLLYCCGNILSQTGGTFQNFTRGDSLRDHIPGQYDYVLSNPPFGLKGVSWAETPSGRRGKKSEAEKWYIPLPSNNSTAMFMQAIVSITKVGGTCAIVLPHGQEMISCTGMFPDLRRLLMTACRLKQFVFVPAGTFDNAKGLKACFLVLEKVADFSQVLTIPGKKYAFTTDLPEYEVEFWDIPEPKEKPVLLFKRKTSQLGRDLELKRESSYVDRYKFEEKTVKLGSICRINGGTYITKEELKSKPGEFLVIGGGVKPLGTYYTSNARPNSILIAKDGSAGHISTYPSEVFVSHHCSYIDNISPLFNESFLFYFLKYIKEGEIKSKKSGAAQPNITKKVIEEIEIPLFPLEKQKLIAEECAKYHDDLQGIDAKIKTLEKNVSKLGIPILSEEVCLDKICQIKIGVALTKKNIVKGPYPVIGGGCKPLGFHNSSNVKKDSILISRMGAAGHVSRYNKDLYATEVCFYLDEISPKFSPEYLYFYLKYAKEEEIKSKKYGAAQPGINRKILQNIGIENVSLEEQEEFVNYVRRRLIRKERILLSTLEEKKDLLLEMYNVFGQKCEHKIGEDTYKKSLARIRSFFHSAVNNEDIKSFLRETDYFIRQDDFEIEIEIETEEDDEELSELDE